MKNCIVVGTNEKLTLNCNNPTYKGQAIDGISFATISNCIGVIANDGENLLLFHIDPNTRISGVESDIPSSNNITKVRIIANKNNNNPATNLRIETISEVFSHRSRAAEISIEKLEVKRSQQNPLRLITPFIDLCGNITDINSRINSAANSIQSQGEEYQTIPAVMCLNIVNSALESASSIINFCNGNSNAKYLRQVGTLCNTSPLTNFVVESLSSRESLQKAIDNKETAITEATAGMAEAFKNEMSKAVELIIGQFEKINSSEQGLESWQNFIQQSREASPQKITGDEATYDTKPSGIALETEERAKSAKANSQESEPNPTTETTKAELLSGLLNKTSFR